jgi:hypothetical protein
MITSGLVITLSADPRLAGAAEHSLRLHPGIVLGQPQHRWLPLVAQTDDVHASRDLHDWLGNLPGVEFVDVVHVSFGDTGDSSSNQEGQT